MTAPMNSILVVRLGHLGDVVHALPAVAALRDAFPSARIGWAIEERWTDLLSAAGARSASTGNPEKPLVDTAHLVSTKAWRGSPLSSATWSEAAENLRAIRTARYDAVVDFQGLWKSGLVARWSAAPVRVGFRRPRELGVSRLYTRRVAPRRRHVIEQNLELVETLTGKPSSSVRFPVPRDEAAEAWCEQELARRGLTAFAILSPGGGWGAKLWPAASYGRLARLLADQASLPSLVNVGPDQNSLGELVESVAGDAAQAIGCSVARLVALLRRASLVIGGDTGPAHLAAALGAPVVALFGPTSPERNGPFGLRTVTLRSPRSRTSYSHVERPDPNLVSILPEQVLAEALALLGRSGSATARRS